MRFLFTADMHAEWSNIDLCKQAWLHCIDLCKERGLEGIGVLGDCKTAYNPVDIRVTKFWVWAIAYATKAKIRVIFILGNHDRVGQYTDAQNWLSIFKKVGAEAYDEPGIINTNDGERMFLLPYSSSLNTIKNASDNFVERRPDKNTDILLFHANLKGVPLNKTGHRSEGGLRVDDLHPDKYRYCIGGDVHLPQKIGDNVYYTGSPFCMDWGECNQGKRFVIVRDEGIEFVPSSIPGWFDDTWPGFDAEKVKKGSRIRIHVSCNVSENYGRTLERARREAEHHYKGAFVYTVAEFADDKDEHDVKIKSTDPDSTKIKAYVKETIPNELRSEERKIVTYLSHQMEKAVGRISRVGTGLKFRKVKATNFLSFKKLELDYKQKGIVVVQGINGDWQGRSNGSGKTSAMQPIPVAMFGRTFKGQKHDQWARRFTSKEASVKLYFQDNRGRNVIVERTRRPSSLHLEINKIDQSSGLRGSSKEATQGMIEQVTGFTWHTLANAVYIDQSVTKAFLGGTKKERTDVLSKFQNLERFEKALLIVKGHRLRQRDTLIQVQEDIAVCRARIEECKESLSDTQRTVRESLRDAKDKWYEAIRVAERANREFNTLRRDTKVRQKKCRKAYSTANDKLATLEPQWDRLMFEQKVLNTKIYDCRKCTDDIVCPTCLQPVDKKLLQTKIRIWKTKLELLDRRIKTKKGLLDGLRLQAGEVEARNDELSMKLARHEQSRDEWDSKAAYAGQAYKDLKRKDNAEQLAVDKYRRKFRILKKQRKALKRYQVELEKSEGRLSYCEEAFSRDGIPAFLNRLLAPILNKSAEYYADLFADKYIQVRFEVVDGEFEPRILNATGGEALDDQSVGEKALAGLITSFALREVAPTCNMLVLDEPGDGLDAVNARKFARALPQLKERFGLILLTTHNPVILSELSGEQKMTVVKRNRISRIVGSKSGNKTTQQEE